MFKRVALLTAVLVASTAAHAQTAAPAPAPAPAAASSEADWQLGAGVGFSFFGLGLGLSGLDSTLTPTAIVAVERRLAPATWLRLGLNGGYADGSTTDDEVGGVALALGVRQVFTPRSIVELSAFGDFGFAYNHVKSAGTFGAEFDGFGLDITAGVAVERELIDRLSLRLSLGLFDAGFQVVSPEVGDSQKGFNVNVVFRPGLTLQFQF